MVQTYLEALNTKGFVPDWQSAWDVTVKIAYQRASMNQVSLNCKFLCSNVSVNSNASIVTNAYNNYMQVFLEK